MSQLLPASLSMELSGNEYELRIGLGNMYEEGIEACILMDS